VQLKDAIAHLWQIWSLPPWGPRSNRCGMQSTNAPLPAPRAASCAGPRVPILLTSRADSVRTRLASCAVAPLHADGRRPSAALQAT
jgi:hypothetical protein